MFLFFSDGKPNFCGDENRKLVFVMLINQSKKVKKKRKSYLSFDKYKGSHVIEYWETLNEGSIGEEIRWMLWMSSVLSYEGYVSSVIRWQRDLNLDWFAPSRSFVSLTMVRAEGRPLSFCLNMCSFITVSIWISLWIVRNSITLIEYCYECKGHNSVVNEYLEKIEGLWIVFNNVFG